MNNLELKEANKAKLFAAIKDTQITNPYTNSADNNKNVSLNTLKKKGLLSAYERAIKLIDDRDISSNDKDRLKKEVGRELNVSEAEYENS